MDILTDASVTLADRTVLIYMLARAAQPRWTLYVAEVTRTMGLSHGGWRACRRRLEAAGYYRHLRRRRADGKWEWEVLVSDTPHDFGEDATPTEVRKPDLGRAPHPTIPHDVTDGGMTGRGATGRGRGDRRINDLRIQTQQHGTQAGRSAAASLDGVTAVTGVGIPDSGGAPPTESRKPELGNPAPGNPQPGTCQPGRKRLRTHAPTGAVYWLDDEPAELDTLVEVFGLAEVKKAVAALVGKGTDPLHGRLRAFLLSQRRAAAEADATASRRRETTEEERAEDARRAREAIAAFKAGRDAPEQPRHRDTRSMEQILIEQFGVKTA